ncbi:MAG: Hsp20/alpha crystallin family protein [Halodesulfurarchaeum sp.]
MIPDRAPIFEYGRSVGQEVLSRMGRASGRLQEESPLPADVLESEDEYLVIFDAPGATATDIQVQLSDGTLEVRIDRFRAFREDYEMVFPGRGLELDGRISLPDDAVADGEDARAVLEEDGTLSVFVPKEGSGADDAEVDGEPPESDGSGSNSSGE